jgi:hypothetical protein
LARVHLFSVLRQTKKAAGATSVECWLLLRITANNVMRRIYTMTTHAFAQLVYYSFCRRSDSGIAGADGGRSSPAASILLQVGRLPMPVRLANGYRDPHRMASRIIEFMNCWSWQMTYIQCKRWKNSSSKSSSTGQFDWPMGVETHIQWLQMNCWSWQMT